MLGFFKKVSDKITNNMLAPGSEESDGYYEEDSYYEEDYDDGYYDEPEPARKPTARKPAKNSSSSLREYSGPSGIKNNVYGFTSRAADIQKQAETVISHPKNMEDAVAIGNHVRSGRQCIVDLTGVPTPEAQRIADYLCGNSDALDGMISRINNTMIAISPPNHRIMPDYRDDASYDTGSFLKTASR
ncbi:MAG: cell division protein SepF [Clostridiales bacterium]|jgi:FtsZ-interacting cell division protein YlmF|nr:cell division protein SepF [Clostridiales bacterium]